MNKSQLFTNAHKIAKTLEGDYRARFAYALTQAWKEVIVMKINHNILGSLSVEFTKQLGHPSFIYDELCVTINDKKILCHLFIHNGITVLKFFKSHKLKQSKEKIDMLRISKTDYNMIFEATIKEKNKINELKYQEFLNEKVVYTNLSKFRFDNFSDDAQTLVFEDLKNKIPSEFLKNKKPTYTDFIEYYRNLTNKEIVNLLEIKENEVIKTKKDKELQEKMKLESIFKKAKITGENQVLESYSVDCNDYNEDCDVDIITKYATPDGKIKTVRNHTW